MKKVIIIGAGIAGLTCGVYTQINGFETQILELHSISGGECTGWDRGGYHFDGCIQWMMGTKEGVPLHQVWNDTGALDDSVRIINHEIYTRYEDALGMVNVYTNADQFEQELLRVAPEDKKEIKDLINGIRKMGAFTMPVEKPMDQMNGADGIKFAFKNRSLMGSIMKYNKMSVKELAERFKSQLLRNMLQSMLSEQYSSMALVSMFGGMNAGDCGYPEGGSRAVAERMEKKFVSLGGEIQYGARVDKILVKGGTAVGVRLTDGNELYADEVISCADGYATLMHMLEDKYTPDQYRNLFDHPDKYPTVTSSLVFMGIDAEVLTDCRGLTIRREKPVSLNGLESDHLDYISYAFDRNMSPEGKTVVCCYYEANFEYWNRLYQDKEQYKKEKKRLEEDAVTGFLKRFPELAGKIEITDVVTPMTYVRYCNAWRGAWMTWVKSSKGVPRCFSGILPGLNNFMMAGMWTLPPGGLPGAGAAGKFAAQRLCMQNGIAFKAGK